MHRKQNHINDKYLDHDIRQTIGQFPDLKYRVTSKNQRVLEGQFHINDDEGVKMDSVELKIIYPDSFPYIYPAVIETGGRFSRMHGQMHLNGDGTLCLTSPQQERVDCYSGINTLLFFDQILVPNLSWRICVLENIPFERKEFGHSMDGIIQSYQELLVMKQPASIHEFINRFLNNSLPERNQDCFCGSGKKYKVCHRQFESNLVKIGHDMLNGHLPIIARMKK